MRVCERSDTCEQYRYSGISESGFAGRETLLIVPLSKEWHSREDTPVTGGIMFSLSRISRG